MVNGIFDCIIYISSFPGQQFLFFVLVESSLGFPKVMDDKLILPVQPYNYNPVKQTVLKASNRVPGELCNLYMF